MDGERASRGEHLPWIAVALATALSLVLLGRSLGAVARPASSDGDVYLASARALAERGPAALAEDARAFVEDPGRSAWPSPLRVGYVALAAGWLALSGEWSVDSLARLSLAAHAVLVVAAYLLARRALGPPLGALAAVLTAFSTLPLALGRLPLADAWAGATVALALWRWLVWRERGRRARDGAWFAVAFAAALLVKETTVLLAPAFLVEGRCGGPRLDGGDGVLGRGPERTARRALSRDAAALAAPLVLALIVWTLACGGPGRLGEVLAVAATEPGRAPYAVRYQSGPWYRYIVDLLLLSPWTTLLAIAGLGRALVRWREGTAGGAERLAALALACGLLGLAFLSKNARFLSFAVVPISLLATGWLGELAAALRPRARLLGPALAVLAVCALEVASWREIFVERQAYDPVTAVLAIARRIVPWSGR